MLLLKFSSRAITWWRKVGRQSFSVTTHKIEEGISCTLVKVSTNRATGKALEDTMSSINFMRNSNKGGLEYLSLHFHLKKRSAIKTSSSSTSVDFI